jgi:tetratricopeptide (TPR) repeat protein
MQQVQDAKRILDEGLRAYQSRQYAQAEAGFRRALGLAPDYAPCYVNLTAALHAQGKCDEAISWCEKGLVRFPDNLDLIGNLAVNFDTSGRHDEAIALLDRTLEAFPRNAGAHHHIGTLHLKTGSYGKAATHFRTAAEINPRNVLSFSGRGEALLKSGNAAEAIEAFDGALRLHPFDVRSLALKTLALAECGRSEEERWLADPFRLAQVLRLSEFGYSAEAQKALNAGLAEFAANHPSMQQDPPENATYKGWHSGNLGDARHPAVEQLRRFIAYALEQRRKILASEDPAHPFVRARPKAFNLHLWCVKLVGEGKMVPHIHTSGWLSGVYYVDVPAVVDDEGAEQAGWLRLGPARNDIPMTREPVVRAMKPEPGLMFTFPSYIWHETVPLPAGSAQRLCYSYDLQPA